MERMSLETNTAADAARIAALAANGGPAGGGGDAEYWHGLINEKVAGAFLGLTDRTMQGYRRKGGGPEFIRISSRCLRYTRFKCRVWYEARLRASTSDPGPEANAASQSAPPIHSTAESAQKKSAAAVSRGRDPTPEPATA